MLERLIVLAIFCACSAAAANVTWVRPSSYRNHTDLPHLLQKDTVKVLEYVHDGNRSHLVRLVKDENGTESTEYVNIITINDDYMVTNNGFEDDDGEVFYDRSDSLEILEDKKKTRVTRSARKGSMNRCSEYDSMSCYVLSPEGKPFFEIGFKYLSCPSVFANRIKFRFRARLPGTYILRLSSHRGSYVIVIRTYKKFQVVTFQWPRSKVHLGKYFKLFLMVLPRSENSLFDGSFSWSAINVEQILQGSTCSSDQDFDLIFKQKNVALLEQMSRFDNCRYVKIASSTFDLTGNNANKQESPLANNANEDEENEDFEE